MSAKQDVLRLLESNKGSILSGNEIALSLSITRTAVWKAINSLKEGGYQIAAVNKKGYCLNEQNDILSPQSIKPYLHDADRHEMIVHKSLDSTNTLAKALANADAKSGTVVIAEQQTEGKGRLGRRFHSPNASGIYMTVIFRLKNSIEQSMLITSAAAVAVCRAIKTVCDLECQIKWVNDVYLDGKKLCGILTEASVNFEAGQLDYVVVGIGINVTANDFPEELREVATSLEEKAGGMSISRSRLIGEVLNELAIVIEDLQEKQFLQEYKTRSFILGSEINVISPTDTKRATALDFNEFGHLVVRFADGEVKTLSSGEISIRKV